MPVRGKDRCSVSVHMHVTASMVVTLQLPHDMLAMFPYSPKVSERLYLQIYLRHCKTFGV